MFCPSVHPKIDLASSLLPPTMSTEHTVHFRWSVLYYLCSSMSNRSSKASSRASLCHCHRQLRPGKTILLLVSPTLKANSISQWSSSLHLVKEGDGFVGKTGIPWGEKLTYKFIVDGEWTTHPDQPTETDPSGNVNNIYKAPSEPKTATATANGSAKGASAPNTETNVLSDIATTIAAADGTSSALDYVTSGVGAALHSVIGVDPFGTERVRTLSFSG